MILVAVSMWGHFLDSCAKSTLDTLQDDLDGVRSVGANACPVRLKWRRNSVCFERSTSLR